MAFRQERSGKLADFPLLCSPNCQRAETVLLGRYSLDAFDGVVWFFLVFLLGTASLAISVKKNPALSLN